MEIIINIYIQHHLDVCEWHAIGKYFEESTDLQSHLFRYDSPVSDDQCGFDQLDSRLLYSKNTENKLNKFF